MCFNRQEHIRTVYGNFGILVCSVMYACEPQTSFFFVLSIICIHRGMKSSHAKSPESSVGEFTKKAVNLHKSLHI